MISIVPNQKKCNVEFKESVKNKLLNRAILSVQLDILRMTSIDILEQLLNIRIDIKKGRVLEC